MSLLEMLSRPECWERYYAYKTSLAFPVREAEELRRFIDRREYLPAAEGIYAGEDFPLPAKRILRKQGTEKKRTVYIYPKNENTVLKLLTYLMIRKYDGLFADNLYSFRAGRGAKDAVKRLRSLPGIGSMYSYKTDISNYFNSIPMDRFLPVLHEALCDDPELFSFLKSLLMKERALLMGEELREQMGIMAGCPLASFFANLYLKDLDRLFAARGIPYARYSDDIILFAGTREERDAYAEEVRGFLAGKGLSVNPAKEICGGPEDGFVFLGFLVKGGETDIAPASVVKLKKKMRRKARALLRWRLRNDIEGEKAGRAFVRIFKRKLLESSFDKDLSWSGWFFSMITTTESLREIDSYAEDCLRFLVSGRRTKARYNVRYEDIKALGFESLVHAYYRYEGNEKK
ncbi:MAG: reverse transcriptase domain-containing protein [Lachnospiraceae bacterium]|nr:reverse transcriptase domain-containing protein [Lachnospiraceae bacterium]